MGRELQTKFQHQAEKVRVRTLFRQNRVAQVASLLNGAIFVFLFSDTVSKTALGIWIAWFLAIFAARHFFLVRFKTYHINRRKDFDPIALEKRFSLGVFLSGLTWGAAASVMIPHGDVYHHAFLGYILAGTTAGAAVAYCASLRAIYSFLLPALIPFGIRLFIEGTPLHYGMLGMLVCYIISFAKLTKMMNAYVTSSIKLCFEKGQLLAEKDELLSELGRIQTKATQSTKMAALGEMASGIAHEINNPLAIIQGNSQIIQDLVQMGPVSATTITPLTDTIETTVIRIAKIIKSLRAFAREANSDPTEKVAVKKIIEDTMEFCRARFKNHGVVLHVTLPPPELEVDCRPVQISQVLLNLLNNSFDAVSETPEKWVKLDINETANEILFTITDSGRGIPKEYRDKIMQPFFTSKEPGRGTGLGLSISKGIVESHKGTLVLDESCKNTTFTFSLPKVIALQQSASNAA